MLFDAVDEVLGCSIHIPTGTLSAFEGVYHIPTGHVTVSIALAIEARAGSGIRIQGPRRHVDYYCPLVIHFLPAGDWFLPAFLEQITC